MDAVIHPLNFIITLLFDDFFQRELLHYSSVSYLVFDVMTESTNVQFDQTFKINLAHYIWSRNTYEQINFPVHFPRQSCFETLRILIPPLVYICVIRKISPVMLLHLYKTWFSFFLLYAVEDLHEFINLFKNHESERKFVWIPKWNKTFHEFTEINWREDSLFIFFINLFLQVHNILVSWKKLTSTAIILSVWHCQSSGTTAIKESSFFCGPDAVFLYCFFRQIGSLTQL